MAERKDFHFLYQTNNDLVNETNEHNFEVLKEELKKVGYNLSITKVSEDMNMIAFYQTDAYENKMKRNAGRKRKETSFNVRLSEVRKEIEELNADQVAKKYGVGRSTLFRRMKEVEESGKDYYIF